MMNVAPRKPTGRRADQRRHTIDTIGMMLKQIRFMAEREDLDMLTYLVAMAEDECGQQFVAAGGEAPDAA